VKNGSTLLRDYVLWLSDLRFTDERASLAAEPKAMAEATSAARSWLHLLDRGDYAASFEQAAVVVRRAVDEHQWDRAARAVRAPLGRCLSRRFRSLRFVRSRSSNSRGPCAVIEFESDFEGKDNVVETLTPALGSDGRWRVAGYMVA
jgi:hypothetical protein